MLNDSQNSRKNRPASPKPQRRNTSTMNVPDSGSLNSNASATVAAQFFAKDIGSEDYKPSIANSFIPPVLDNKTEEKAASPFKAPPKAPIKRPKNAANVAFHMDEEETKEDAPKAPEGPQIARFMDIPVLKKPESPFVPLGQAPANNGLKAPIKRPASASVNHAAARKEEEEREKIKAELDAMGGAFKPKPAEEPAPLTKPAAPSSRSAFSKSPAEKTFVPLAPVPKKPVTSDKTFVPLAPVPVTEQKKDEAPSPFAPPVQKTEEQIRREEENARIALEKSRVEVKKSRLDKFMDGLNRPLF